MSKTKACALVTGANRGLGREVAAQLSGRGLTVYAAGRHIADAEAAVARMTGDAHAIRLDVTDPDSVTAAAQTIETEQGRLDVLINNAGVIFEAPAFETDAAVLRQNFETNVFGAATVLTTLLPLLRCSVAPRVVNVSSTTASMTRTSAGTDFGGDAGGRLAYSASKAALNMLTVQWARAAEDDPRLRGRLKVNSGTPGFVATDLNQHTGTRTVAEGAAIIVALATLGDDGPTGGFFNDDGPVEW